MLEYVTEAIVLDKVDLGELDSRVYLFTKDFGKITAKIKSGRKIISKLASHTEPLNLVTVRIVDKNSPQLIDALISKKGIPGKTLFKIVSLVRDISPEGQPDHNLWELLVALADSGAKAGDFSSALKILGFDPTCAKCNNCLKGSPDFFSVKDLIFYCKDCYQ
ncbi:MAG: recombination protein O N-terminal domain-containing protein [bacterium]|nr:recombination protein O N-terminal domain-containing protein [bacterium]